MEKDLRDAYAALKLLRADLVQTRRDKRTLEATVKHLETHGPPPSAAMTRESRETLQMKEEDARSLLWRVTQEYDNKIRVLEDENISLKRKEEHGPEQEPQEDHDEVEKLTLLAKIHKLTKVVEEKENSFEVERKEFEIKLEDSAQELEKLQQQMETKKLKILAFQQEREEMEKNKLQMQKAFDDVRIDVESVRKEMQERTDKYEEERRQLEKKLAAYAQTSSILQQQLTEKEEDSTKLIHDQEQREVGLRLEHERIVDETEKSLTARLRQDHAKKENDLQQTHQREKFELQEKLAVLELEMSSEREKTLQKKEEAQERYATTLRDLQDTCTELQEQLSVSEAKLAKLTQENEHALENAAKRVAQHENTVRTLSLKKMALQQEVHEAQQTAEGTKQELTECQSKVEEYQQEERRLLARCELERESLESQLMGTEDRKVLQSDNEPGNEIGSLESFRGLNDEELTALPASELWVILRTGINELGDFLPSFQTLVQALVGALALCESQADILPVLCEQLQYKMLDQEPQEMTSTALVLLRFAAMIQSQCKMEKSGVTLKLVHNFLRQLLGVLAQWYECDASDSDDERRSAPTPAFAIASRETALILQNWTRDRKKQLGVKRWLARMEAYPNAPLLRGTTAKESKVLELPPEGCTLELEDMTPEVKDAFRLLLIPILKQNRALHVRVFTRYTGSFAAKKSGSQQNFDNEEREEDKAWAMRIHIQSASARRSRGNRPLPLNLTPSPRGFPSPLAPTSPASSVASSASSTASTRLQIIQERLQSLYSSET